MDTKSSTMPGFNQQDSKSSELPQPESSMTTPPSMQTAAPAPVMPAPDNKPETPTTMPQAPVSASPVSSTPSSIPPLASTPSSEKQAAKPLSMTPPPVSDKPDQSEHHKSGKLVFIIVGILIVLAVIGGYLLFMMYGQQPPTPETEMPEPTGVMEPSPTEDPTATQSAIEQLNDVSTSDQVDALQEDLQNTNFSVLDQDVSDLEKSL